MVSGVISKTAPMTVLHVFSGDLWAGAERMIATLLTDLRSRPDIKIIALSLNEGALSRTLHESGIETIVIPENAHSFVTVFLKALSHLKRGGVQLIHAHRYKENLLSLLLGKFLGVNHLLSTVHGLPEPSSSKYSRRISHVLKTKLDHLLLKHAFTQVIAVSHDVKNALIHEHGFNPAEVVVIHNGIDIPSVTSHKLPSDTVTHIGTVGRMVPIKEFGLFLEVAAEVRKRVQEVYFSILGEGPLKEELARRVKELGLDEKVRLEAPRADPFTYYTSLDLYLNTSLHEGLPLSILEAMACGKPVVAPKVGGLPEIITHAEEGFLVESRSPKDFAEWCVKLIRNKELRTIMGQKALKKVTKSFSSHLMADSYHRLYQTLSMGMQMQDSELRSYQDADAK
jgi:glycosyltransferase involved in cell wall biosynthesis